MAQRPEVVERHARVGTHAVALADLAEELCLADAVDPQVTLQVGIQFHDLPRIPRLLDHEPDHERFQLRRRATSGLGRGGRGRRGRRNAVHPVGFAAAGRQQAAKFIERGGGEDGITLPR